MKIMDESILFFSRVSLSKFSLEALYISWCVRMECEESVFQNRAGWRLGLAT